MRNWEAALGRTTGGRTGIGRWRSVLPAHLRLLLLVASQPLAFLLGFEGFQKEVPKHLSLWLEA